MQYILMCSIQTNNRGKFQLYLYQEEIVLFSFKFD